jgi:hypothetical protein
MYGLIQCLYNKTQQEALEKLYADSDSSTQLLIRSTIANALKDYPKIIESHGADWLLCTLAMNKKSEEDTVRVYQGVMNMLNKMSFGILTDDIKFKEMKDIADACLVGIGFFRKHMETLHNRKAAPSVSYYRKAGAVAFKRLGFEEIGKNFNDWTDFIEKELTTMD